VHNRVHFTCPFHGESVTATLTLEDDGHFICAFRLQNRTIWPVQGRWTRAAFGQLHLRTHHGYVTVWLQENPDHTLSGLDQQGGLADFNIRGVRSSALPRPLPRQEPLHA
jgi:hypothetical protein